MARRRIVITGASRGIGEALALEYADPGTSLVLLGRDLGRLEAVATACRAAGAEASARILDIRERPATENLLQEIDAAAPIDLLVANAGVHRPTTDDPGDNRSAFQEVETNFIGTLNTVVPVAALMAGRGRGQIAVMSSLAAYAAMADSPGYSASKAGLLVYGLSLRARLRETGVKVNVICPGYVAAGMGLRNTGWKPLSISASRTAAVVRRGLERNRPVIAFPRPLAWMARATQAMPEWLSRRVLQASRFEVVPQDETTRNGSGGMHG